MKHIFFVVAFIAGFSGLIAQEEIYMDLQETYNKCSNEDCVLKIHLDLKEKYSDETSSFLNIIAYANEQRKYNPKKAFETIKGYPFKLTEKTPFEQGAYYQALGAISIISENPKVALNHFKSAQKAFSNSNSIYYTAKSYMSIGRTYTAMGALDSGLVYLHEASALIKTKFPKLNQLINLNKAVNHKLAGNFEEAKLLFSNALENMTSIEPEAYIQCRTQANLAEIFMQEGNFVAADSLYQLALLRSITHELRSDEIRINKDLSRLYEYKKEYKKSLFYRNRSDSLRDNARLISIADQLGQLENRHELEILSKEKEYEHQLLLKERKASFTLIVSLLIVTLLLALLLKQFSNLRNKNKVLLEKIKSKNSVKSKEKAIENNAHLLPIIKNLENIQSNDKVIFQASLTLSKLAKELNTNRSYLSEAINIGFNSTFSNWINQLRIEKACELLADPENDKFSLEAIAKMVGFSSISSFNTNFKRITGLTPSYYKNHRLSN